MPGVILIHHHEGGTFGAGAPDIIQFTAEALLTPLFASGVIMLPAINTEALAIVDMSLDALTDSDVTDDLFTLPEIDTDNLDN